MSFQAYLDNVEKKTGRTPQQLVEEATTKDLTERKAIMDWLMTDYDLGHGHANAIDAVIRHPEKYKGLRLSGIP